MKQLMQWKEHHNPAWCAERIETSPGANKKRGTAKLNITIIMNLKVFNSENSRSSKTGVHGITMNSKSGGISLSGSLQESMGLKVDDKVSIAQNQDSPLDWYIFKSDDGFQCREKPKATGLIVQNTAVVRALFESARVSEQSASMLVSKEPVSAGGG